MAEPKQKDAVDIAIDFFFGAVLGNLLAIGTFSPRFRQTCRFFFNIQWSSNDVLISIFAATLICGSLAALFRNDFWGAYSSYRQIPPMEETVSREAKVILWMLFAVGCASLGLFFIW